MEDCQDNDPQGFNTFNNDGSFFEKFKKMQEEKKPEPPPTTIPKPAPAPLLRKAKPMIMKMSGIKKKVPLVKPLAASGTGVAKAFGDSDLSHDKDEKMGEGSSQESKRGQDPLINRSTTDIMSILVSTETSNIPLVQSIAAERIQPNSIATERIQPNSSVGEQAPPAPQLTGKKRKRSRWSDEPPTATPPSNPLSGKSQGADAKAIVEAMGSFSETPSTSLPYGGNRTSGQQLTPMQLKQIEEQIEMNKLVAQIRAVTQQKTTKKKNPDQPQFEYDSDEDIEGGTWEHKKRAQEMLNTYDKAVELTEKAQGKHHIGDFLPPEEFKRFLEKVQAIKEGRDPDLSDYREHKLTESNIGFRLLQKAGWTEGQGLGEKEDGITAPINKGKTSFEQAGVGAEVPCEVAKDDSEFDTYRKRMMLAYRFRPNPLNNPRRPYY